MRIHVCVCIYTCVCVCVYMYENCVNICLNIYIHIHSIFTSIIMYVHMYKYFVGNRNCNIFNYTTLPMQLLSTVILEPTNPEPQSYKTKKQNRTYTKKTWTSYFQPLSSFFRLNIQCNA